MIRKKRNESTLSADEFTNQWELDPNLLCSNNSIGTCLSLIDYENPSQAKI
jgi:hypothetical protein